MGDLVVVTFLVVNVVFLSVVCVFAVVAACVLVGACVVVTAGEDVACIDVGADVVGVLTTTFEPDVPGCVNWF